MGAMTTASVISIAVFTLWLQKEETAVLFTNLTPEDAAVAIEELAKQDVSAELTNGGTTILVPRKSVHRMRVDLAGKGVPSSGVVGFEIFDGKQYGLTEFLQNVNFKRALEGELTKSIESLQGIQSARVHLVLPKPSIFKKLDSPATASVILQLGRGARLENGRIHGIQSLVAGSVENLAMEQVTVIDQYGKVLSQEIKDGETGRSESQLALRKEVEGHLAQKAGTMLDGVLGLGRSIVQVDATLNFEKIDRERELYDPQNTVVRSEVRNETTDPQTGGTDENNTTNYEINRTVEHIVGEIGAVKRLSVAVFVDGHYETDQNGAAPLYLPLTEDEVTKLKRIVQTAVGLNVARGDQIEMVNMQFRKPEISEPEPFSTNWIPMVTRYGGKALILLVFVIVLLSLRKGIGGILAMSVPRTRTRVPTAGEASESEHFEGIPDMDDQVINDIQDYASENPERVADVVQSWIHEMNLGNAPKEKVGDSSER
ncbi:MAG: flagellar M-ring protein FliF [Candidatus Krumholzibacteria bacterium]|nr:flagellar M-ring protein FliF [Candidatus Krumholzibacteria bacterium]